MKADGAMTTATASVSPSPKMGDKPDSREARSAVTES